MVGTQAGAAQASSQPLAGARLALVQSRTINIAFAALLVQSCRHLPPQPSNAPDTTSHSFIWQIDTLGVFQSSLADVWGTSMTNVYAVGRIARTDSIDYNIAHFNGQTWSPFYIFYGTPPARGAPSLRGILGFSATDIWAVGTGSVVAHWNGSQWTMVSLGTCDDVACLGITNGEQLNAVWGTSSSDLFAVGETGLIVHYDGQTWTKMNSGTSLTFYDVWGSSSTNVFATAMDYMLGEWLVLRYRGSSWEPDSVDSKQINRPGGIWGTAADNVYLASDFVGHFDGKTWKRETTPNVLYNMGGVEGSAPNNIFVVGSFGVVLHWNGSTWYQYDQLLQPAGGRKLERIWTNGDEVLIIGSTGSQAVVIHGR